MISFNDLKNNVEIMRNYLKQMHFFNQKSTNIKYGQFEQDFLRKNFPNIFLQILHFALIQFSYSLFQQILQQCPTIRTDNDLPFIQHAIVVSRNLLKVDVKIDANQFFNPNKFFQKKVELASKICKATYQFQISQTKGNSGNSNFMNINKAKPLAKDQTSKNSKIAKNYIQDDDDQDMPRQIKVMPTKKIQPSINNSNCDKNQKYNNSDSDQQLKLLRERKNKIQNNRENKKQITPYQQKQDILEKKTVSRLNRNIEATRQEKQQVKNQNNNSKPPTKIVHYSRENPQRQNQNLEKQQYEQQQQSEEYMTKKQALQIMSALNANISSLINNFTNFQKDVSTWMNNVNAKVSLLEQNVKTIRNNL